MKAAHREQAKALQTVSLHLLAHIYTQKAVQQDFGNPGLLFKGTEAATAVRAAVVAAYIDKAAAQLPLMRADQVTKAAVAAAAVRLQPKAKLLANPAELGVQVYQAAQVARVHLR